MLKTTYDVYRHSNMTTVELNDQQQFQLLRASTGTEYGRESDTYLMCHKPDIDSDRVFYIDENAGYLMKAATWHSGAFSFSEKVVSLEALKLLQQYCQAMRLLAPFGPSGTDPDAKQPQRQQPTKPARLK